MRFNKILYSYNVPVYWEIIAVELNTSTLFHFFIQRSQIDIFEFCVTSLARHWWHYCNCLRTYQDNSCMIYFQIFSPCHSNLGCYCHLNSVPVWSYSRAFQCATVTTKFFSVLFQCNLNWTKFLQWHSVLLMHFSLASLTRFTFLTTGNLTN